MSGDPAAVLVVGIGRRGRLVVDALRSWSFTRAGRRLLLHDPNITASQLIDTAGPDAVVVNHPKDIEHEACGRRPYAVITTPVEAHLSCTTQWIEYTRGLLLEKPSVVDPTEFAQLAELIQRHRTPIVLGYSERYNPAPRPTRDVLTAIARSGSLQALRIMRGRPRSARTGPDRDAVTELAVHDVDLVVNDLYPCVPWRFDVSRDAGGAHLRGTQGAIPVEIEARWDARSAIASATAVVDGKPWYLSLGSGDRADRMQAVRSLLERLMVEPRPGTERPTWPVDLVREARTLTAVASDILPSK